MTPSCSTSTSIPGVEVREAVAMVNAWRSSAV
jgi:hypothetical protein